MVSVELRRFSSARAYNAAHPRCLTPADPAERHRLRGYHLAMRGLADDLTGASGSMIGSIVIDFLPNGPPLPGEPDRVGTVVASRWRRDSFLMLAEDVSLRAVWRAIIRRWPTRLSEVCATLDEVTEANRNAVIVDRSW